MINMKQPSLRHAAWCFVRGILLSFKLAGLYVVWAAIFIANEALKLTPTYRRLSAKLKRGQSSDPARN
jgi:hypothetical protein